MPVWVEDEGITLALKNGATITLVEKPLSVADRKAATKQAMSLAYSLQAKKRKADTIDEQSKGEIDEATAKQLGEEAGELLSSIDIYEIYAMALSRRFESWDFYATKADADAGKPVPLTVEAITEQCKYPARARVIAEIMEALQRYETDDAKKKDISPDNSGRPSMTSQMLQ